MPRCIYSFSFHRYKIAALHPLLALRSTLCESGRGRKRTGNGRKTRGYYAQYSFGLVAGIETEREYFTRCIIWLDVPSFREIYDRASLRAGHDLSDVYPRTLHRIPRDPIENLSPSLLHSCYPGRLSSKFPCLLTRVCGDTCPRVTLQLEQICRQDVVRSPALARARW